MNTVNEEETTIAKKRLNKRPWKRLVFKTPLEVLHKSLKRVALQN
jgi:hypothetical protein